MKSRLTSMIAVAGTLLVVAGCGGSSSTVVSPPAPPPPPPAATEEPPETLEQSLNALGVPTEASPRVDDTGMPIPDTFTPLGRTIVVSDVHNADGSMSHPIGPLQETLLIGLRAAHCLDDDCFATLIDDVTNLNAFQDPELLYQYPDVPFRAQEDLAKGDAAVTTRDGTGADIDGDGRDEIVIAYVNDTGSELRLSVIDAHSPAAPLTDRQVPLSPAHTPIGDVRIATGNFDDDIPDEIAIGIGRTAVAGGPGAAAFVIILDDEAENFRVLSTLTIDAVADNRAISLVLKAAQLDYDMAEELVIMQNEFGSGSVLAPPPNPTNNQYADVETRLHIYDDVATSPVVVDSRAIDVNVSHDPDTMGPATKRALIASAAVGDFDDDALDEIFVAGLSTVPFNANCAQDPNGDSSKDGIGHTLLYLDDLAHGLVTLSEAFDKVHFAGRCPEFSGWLLRWVHVNVLDIDGDTDRELQVNQFVFDTPPEDDQDWRAHALFEPADDLLFREMEANAFFDRSNSVIAPGDVTGDGRRDLVSYLQGEDGIRIYGVDEEGRFRVLKTVETVAPGSGPLSRINPVVEPMNGDSDGTVYAATGKHTFSFTQPIILGVLAAPPCQVGIGQALDECTTTWGHSTSLGIGRERGFQVSTGVTAGIHGDIQTCAGVGVSACTTVAEWTVKATLETELERVRGNSYELSKSIAFTTGPLEDSVVFTVVPVDIYDYEQVAGDPDRIGTILGITIPREMVTRMTEVAFYNANVEEGRFIIDDSVFAHRPGQLDSYPTASQKDFILAERRSQLENVRVEKFVLANPLFDDGAPLDAVEGLEVGPVGAGQGSGSTEIGLDLERESSLAVTHQVKFSLDVEIVGGFYLGGFNIGLGGTHGLNVSKGEATTYGGNVGSISAAQFADNQYSFGLFTYLQADPTSGAEFEVINYWVE